MLHTTVASRRVYAKDVPRAPSSSSSEAKGESTTRRPPSRSEVHVVTEDANPTASRRGEGRAPSLRAAGEWEFPGDVGRAGPGEIGRIMGL
eukprot:s2095_g7.t2